MEKCKLKLNGKIPVVVACAAGSPCDGNGKNLQKVEKVQTILHGVVDNVSCFRQIDQEKCSQQGKKY